MTSWVSLELASEIDPHPDDLLSSIRSILPNIELFIPSKFYNDKTGSYSYSLFDGYCFVRGPYDPVEFLKLKRSPHVSKVLSVRSVPSLTPDSEIEKLKSQLEAMIPKGLQVGDSVTILSGLYKHLSGTVVGVDLESAEDLLVEINTPLKSMTKLTPVSKFFLKKRTSQNV